VHSTVSLVAEIGVWYSTNVVVELYKLVGSADWLGNPVGLVSSISKGVTDLVYKPAEAFMVGPQEFTREFYKGTKSLMQQVRANEVETSTPSLQCVM
jgi:vacuolar protein sorting-associated protein 13A/C